MSVCPTVSVLPFYGCCHPCFYKSLYVVKGKGGKIRDKWKCIGKNLRKEE